MAIYYFDPHTTTNGTGTWASPFTFATNNTSTFTDGDEIRVKGVALTDLLTGSTYSATITDVITYNATGLGTAAAAHDVWYVSEIDCFIVVYDTPTADTIRLNSNSIYLNMPANDWTSGTTYTLQKVDTATYPWFSTAAAATFLYSQNYDNITISDCWVDVGGTPTRVTDGSVKTLLHRSNGSGGGGGGATTVNLGPGNSFSVTSADRTSNCAYGWTVNLNNTHILPSRGGTSVGWSYAGGVNHTVYINQLGGCGYMPNSVGTGWGGLYVYHYLDSTINIVTMQNPLFFSYQTLHNCTFNISLYSGNGGNMIQPPYYQGIASNNTFNFTDVSLVSWGSFGLNPNVPVNTAVTDSTLNITGTVDIFNAMSSAAVFVSDAVPTNTYNFSSATFYDTRRANTNSIPAEGLFGVSVSSSAGNPGFTTVHPPWGNVTLSAAYSSVTEGVRYGSSLGNPNDGAALIGAFYEPYVITIRVASPNTAGGANNLFNTLDNFGIAQKYRTVVFRFLFLDGSDPREYVLLQNKADGYIGTGEDTRYAMLCTKDATVYRTSGPALKMYTQVLYTPWTNVSPTVYPSSDLTYFNGFTKTIKIPVSAASTTVAGYIRSDYASTATGDCRVMILDDKYEVVTYQDMTNASYNSWESFSLNFTPTYAAEYHLAMRNLYPSAGKAFWLDDLTVS